MGLACWPPPHSPRPALVRGGRQGWPGCRGGLPRGCCRGAPRPRRVPGWAVGPGQQAEERAAGRLDGQAGAVPTGPDAKGCRCPPSRGRGARPVRLGSRPGPVWSAHRASPAVIRRPRELWARGRMGRPRRGGQRRGGRVFKVGGLPPPPATAWKRPLLAAARAASCRPSPPPPPAPRVSWSAALRGRGRPRPASRPRPVTRPRPHPRWAEPRGAVHGPGAASAGLCGCWSEEKNKRFFRETSWSFRRRRTILANLCRVSDRQGREPLYCEVWCYGV